MESEVGSALGKTGPLSCLLYREGQEYDLAGLTAVSGNLSFSIRGAVSIIKEELMMEIAKHGEKWMCLECWKKIVAKPGEAPSFPTLRMICDECGGQKVLVTNVRADMLSQSSR